MQEQKKRVFSAGRPASIFKSKPSQRLKTQSNNDQPQQNLQISKNFVRQQSFKKKRTHTKPYHVGTQQILQENNNLKIIINDLQQQVHQQRSRIEMSKKKANKFTKQLNRQFSKELYYSGKNPNSYMITGIKSQYENAKRLYQQKCLQNQQIRRNFQYCNLQQMKIYIQVLQTQNKKLKSKLQAQSLKINGFNRSGDIRTNKKIKKARPIKYQPYEQIQRIYTQNSASNDNNSSSFQHHESKDVLTAHLSQQKTKNLQLNNLLTKYTQQYKFIQIQYREAQKKIEFLQKVIIEKDNHLHHFKRTAKNTQRQKQSVHKQLQLLKQQIKSNQQTFSQKILNLRQKEAKKYQIESEIFRKSLETKNQVIEKLQKQIRYLSTLLSYWKPLDALSRDKDFKQLSDRVVQDKYQDSVKMKAVQKYRRESMESDQILLGLDFGQQQNEHQKSFKSNREQEGIRKTAVVLSQSPHNTSIVLNQKRQHKISSQRHSISSKKMRKVNLNQVKKYGNFLRYRSIASNLNIEQIKQLLSYKGDISNEEQFYHKNEYITMKQIKQIVKSAPFNLTDEAATLVSRYIVEDSSNEYVYCHQDNQIQRSIAKSIMKALIGQYNLLDSTQSTTLWQQLKQIYLINLQSALKTLAPKGTISETKFVQLISGLGIQLKQELKDWIIGQMIMFSSSLQELNYGSLLNR